MIHLDANLIIALVNPSDFHHATASSLTRISETFGCSSVAWTEFHSKPSHPNDIAILQAILIGGILPFDEAAASLAGDLYFQTSSKRRTRLDTMIAATAILAGADLATVNPDDFAAFVPHGLKLLVW